MSSHWKILWTPDNEKLLQNVVSDIAKGCEQTQTEPRTAQATFTHHFTDPNKASFTVTLKGALDSTYDLTYSLDGRGETDLRTSTGVRLCKEIQDLMTRHWGAEWTHDNLDALHQAVDSVDDCILKGQHAAETAEAAPKLDHFEYLSHIQRQIARSGYRVNVVSADRRAGKTTLAVAVANAALAEGKRVLYLSPSTTDPPEVISKGTFSSKFYAGEEFDLVIADEAEHLHPEVRQSLKDHKGKLLITLSTPAFEGWWNDKALVDKASWTLPLSSNPSISQETFRQLKTEKNSKSESAVSSRLATRAIDTLESLAREWLKAKPSSYWSKEEGPKEWLLGLLSKDTSHSWVAPAEMFVSKEADGLDHNWIPLNKIGTIGPHFFTSSADLVTRTEAWIQDAARAQEKGPMTTETKDTLESLAAEWKEAYPEGYTGSYHPTVWLEGLAKRDSTWAPTNQMAKASRAKVSPDLLARTETWLAQQWSKQPAPKDDGSLPPTVSVKDLLTGIKVEANATKDCWTYRLTYRITVTPAMTNVTNVETLTKWMPFSDLVGWLEGHTGYLWTKPSAGTGIPILGLTVAQQEELDDILRQARNQARTKNPENENISADMNRLSPQATAISGGDHHKEELAVGTSFLIWLTKNNLSLRARFDEGADKETWEYALWNTKQADYRHLGPRIWLKDPIPYISNAVYPKIDEKTFWNPIDAADLNTLMRDARKRYDDEDGYDPDEEGTVDAIEGCPIALAQDFKGTDLASYMIHEGWSLDVGMWSFDTIGTTVTGYQVWSTKTSSWVSHRGPMNLHDLEAWVVATWGSALTSGWREELHNIVDIYSKHPKTTPLANLMPKVGVLHAPATATTTQRLKARAKTEAKSAMVTVAGRQLAKAARDPLVEFLTQTLGANRGKALKFLAGPQGLALTKVLGGVGLASTPWAKHSTMATRNSTPDSGYLSDPDAVGPKLFDMSYEPSSKLASIAQSMREDGLADLGDSLADLVTKPALRLVMDMVSGMADEKVRVDVGEPARKLTRVDETEGAEVEVDVPNTTERGVNHLP